MQQYSQYIKEIGRGAVGSRNLDEGQAHGLMCAMLDGGVPDLELGAILLAMRVKGEGAEELRGFFRAMDERTVRLNPPPSNVAPVVLPSYNGARKEANLTPLLALLLKHFGVPVLIHGMLEGGGRVSTAAVLRELDIMPVANAQKAEEALRRDGVTFLPTGAIAPGLAELLFLRARLGVRNSAHTLVKMLNPFGEDSLTVVSFSHPEYQQRLREFYGEVPVPALLLRATEGEPYANPKRRPQLELWRDSRCEVLFEAESGVLKHLPHLPENMDAAVTARWIRQALSGQVPVPAPIINQVACCLYGAGVAKSLNEAKALATLEVNGFAA